MNRSTLILCSCLLLLLSPLARAQQPDIFANPKNLKVLPKDISSKELSETMKGFAFALNARCETCHVGEAGKPLTTFDFVAEEKPKYVSARVMLKMVAAINKKHLSKLGDDRREGVEVRCVTCHRGQERPRLIQDILDSKIAEDGVVAAIAEYKSLREEYYGSHTYDFSDMPLNEYAIGVMQKGDTAGALQLVELNIEYYPDSLWGYWYKGRIQNSSGDVAGAIATFETAAERVPDKAAMLQRNIEMLKKKLESAEQ